MVEYVRGMVVRSRAGHDRNEFFVVLETDGRYALICNGKRRPLEKPKRKKLMHLAATGTVLPSCEIETNRKIRSALVSFK